MPRRRGRPPAYDRDRALDAAARLFRRAGYDATSLDELGAATGMNRPSLYGAFGDKRALYATILARARERGAAAMREILSPERPLREGLRAVYRDALALYLDREEAPEGCLLIGTAGTRAVADPAVRDILRETLAGHDRAFEARFRRAREAGELDPAADPAALALLASATLQSLAVRSRTGEGRAVLDALADAAVDLLCGPPPAGSPPSRG